MNQNLEILLSHLSAEKADLIILILTSQNIESHVHKENNSFHILVHPADIKKARTMIQVYFKENKFFRFKQQLHQIPLSSFKSYSAFSIMGLLWFFHAICIYYNIHEDMILKYGSSSLFIRQGETYRAITALFLHSDARHLVGNMAGMLIFGAPVITLSGFGMGPFMLLFSGTLGNLFNAYFYQTAHLSIGASTAVMGAAGLLAAYQITHPARITPRKKSFYANHLMPIFAGAVLMAMFSQGEHTDIWAHIFGFLSGLGSGIIFFPLNRMLRFPQKDNIALIITIVIIVSSLMAAT